MHGKFGAVVPPMARFHAALVVAQARPQLAFPEELIWQQRLATLGHCAFCNPVLKEAGKGFSKSALQITSEVSRIIITMPFGYLGVLGWLVSVFRTLISLINAHTSS